jgi:hypothetical protein
MIAMFTVVLIQTCRKSRIPFILGLSVLFIVSNCCYLIQNLIQSSSAHYLFMRLLFLAFAQSLLATGHWWFCFEYLDCAYSLPYRLKNEELPKSKRRIITTVFVTLLVVQAVMPLAYCFVVYDYFSSSFH